MNIDNLNFLLDQAERLKPEGKNEFRILDYGCGSGACVELGLERDLDMFGVELFSHGSGTNIKDQVVAKGLYETRIREITDGKMPIFPIPHTHHHMMFDEPLALAMAIKSIALTWRSGI